MGSGIVSTVGMVETTTSTGPQVARAPNSMSRTSRGPQADEPDDDDGFPRGSLWRSERSAGIVRTADVTAVAAGQDQRVGLPAAHGRLLR